ncbi:SCO4225 family membrane protein [Streptomyces sp. CWNU-52B]|uniref:SCO4225 family membrane protein n=1 Tax=unclassified Streptomyces TaxID=2593676 RepID=UPI0039C1FDE1
MTDTTDMTGTTSDPDPGSGSGSGSSRSSPRRLGRRLGHLLGDVFALSYLAVCAALLVWAIVVTAGDSSDESMAGVIPVFATAPASLVPFLMLPGGVVLFVASVVFGALLNALVIGWCSRALRRGLGRGPAS